MDAVTRQRSRVIAPRSPDIKKPKTFYNYGCLLLENKGTIARDHLASERTFLAWLRTSISLASVGIALTQLLKLGDNVPGNEGIIHSSKILGLCFIGLAGITLLIGGFRYFAIQEMLTAANKFPASTVGILIVGICATILSIAIFVIVTRL